MKTINFKYKMKTCISSIVLLFAIFFSINQAIGRQIPIGHQGKLYIDEDCNGLTCLTDPTSIQNKIDLIRTQYQKIVNVLLLTKDCGYEYIGGELFGPEVNGSSIWDDANVDYSILITPNNFVINGEVYYNSDLSLTNSSTDLLATAMGSVMDLNFSDYASKHQCMIDNGLNKLIEIYGNSPAPPCDPPVVDVSDHFIIVDGETGFFTNNSEPTSWLNVNQPIVKRIKSNFCTNVVIYETYGINRFTIDFDKFNETEIYDNIITALGEEKNFVLFVLVPPATGDDCSSQYTFHMIYQKFDNPDPNLCLPQYYNLGFLNEKAIQDDIETHSVYYNPENMSNGVTKGLLKLEKILQAGENFNTNQSEEFEDIPTEANCLPPVYLENMTFPSTEFYEVNSEYYNIVNPTSLNNTLSTEGLTQSLPRIHTFQNGGTDTILFDYAGLKPEVADQIISANELVQSDTYFNNRAVSIVTSSENQSSFTLSNGDVMPPKYQEAETQFKNFDMSGADAPEVLHHIHFDLVKEKVYIKCKFSDSYLNVSMSTQMQYGLNISPEDQAFVAGVRNEIIKNCVALPPSALEMQYGDFDNTYNLSDTLYKEYGYRESTWLDKVNVGMAVLRKVMKEIKIPEVLWAQEGNTNGKWNPNFLIRIPPTVAGAGDFLIEELKSLPDLVVFAASFALDAQVRSDVYKVFQDPMKLVRKMMGTLLFQNSQHSLDIQFHDFTKEVMLIAVAVITGGAAAVAVFNSIRKHGVKAMADKAINQIKKVSDAPAAIKNAFTTKMSGFSKNIQDKFWVFIGKFTNKDINMAKFANNPDLVDIWNRFKDAPDLDLNNIFNKFPEVGPNSDFFYKSTEFQALINVGTDVAKIEKLKNFLKDVEGSPTEFITQIVTSPKLIKAWEIMFSKPNLRTDASLLKRMSDDISIEPLFETWIKNNPSKLDAWKNWKGTYNSAGDPVRDILGSGKINNTSEWNQLISELEAAGVEIVFKPNVIAYAPGTKVGNPGQLQIDPNASITALRHEHRHFLDDQAEGFRGFQGVYDPNFRVTTEYNAYKLEIEAMINMGETSVVTQLKNNFLNEVNDIQSVVGNITDPSVAALIDDLMNL